MYISVWMGVSVSVDMTIIGLPAAEEPLLCRSNYPFFLPPQRLLAVRDCFFWLVTWNFGTFRWLDVVVRKRQCKREREATWMGLGVRVRVRVGIRRYGNG